MLLIQGEEGVRTPPPTSTQAVGIFKGYSHRPVPGSRHQTRGRNPPLYPKYLEKYYSCEPNSFFVFIF